MTVIPDSFCPRGHAHRFTDDVVIVNPADIADGAAPGTTEFLVFDHEFAFGGIRLDKRSDNRWYLVLNDSLLQGLPICDEDGVPTGEYTAPLITRDQLVRLLAEGGSP